MVRSPSNHNFADWHRQHPLLHAFKKRDISLSRGDTSGTRRQAARRHKAGPTCDGGEFC